MLTKNSPEVQSLLSRIQAVVPGITGPLGLLRDHHHAEVCIEMTFDQVPPTEPLREFRPGHYSLVVVYVDVEQLHELGWSGLTPAPVWEVVDYGFGQWFIPFIPEEDDDLLDSIMHPNANNRADGELDWF